MSKSAFRATNRSLSVSNLCKATNDKIKPHLTAVLSKKPPRKNRELKRARTLFAKLLKSAARNQNGGLAKVVKVVDITSFMKASAAEAKDRAKALAEAQAVQARAKAKKQAEADQRDKMRQLWRNACRRPVSKSEQRLRRLRESLAPDDWKHLMAGTDEWSLKAKAKRRAARRDIIERNKKAGQQFTPDMMMRRQLEHTAKVKKRRETAKQKAERRQQALYRRKVRHTSAARNERRKRNARAEELRQRAIQAKKKASADKAAAAAAGATAATAAPEEADASPEVAS